MASFFSRYKAALTGKTFIITGASSGLGQALAIELARYGTNLILASRNENALKSVAADCEAAGAPPPLALRTDITRLEDCRNLIARTVERYGTLDYLVLNAGVSMWARFEDVTDLSIYSRLMETNYLGPVNCIHSALPHLLESRGSIVAISSLQGKVGIPLHTGYSASKHALQGFLDALATEQETIHILVVMPTWIKGTSLRANAYGPDGKIMGSSKRAHNSDAVSVQEVSEKIIKAIVRRKSEVVIPGRLKLLMWLQLISPAFVRKLIRNRLNLQDSAA
ncbi:MAG: SDR family oxidoreductase [Candidatus Marinimicrobia bacterium]|nr:SDR family oxidoreductase [Candidatus Neomarinimicrobiota bacterium]